MKSEVESAKKYLLYLIMQSENHFWEAYEAVPMDDEPLTKEEIEAEEEANMDILEGRTFSLEEIKKEKHSGIKSFQGRKLSCQFYN